MFTGLIEETGEIASTERVAAQNRGSVGIDPVHLKNMLRQV